MRSKIFPAFVGIITAGVISGASYAYSEQVSGIEVAGSDAASIVGQPFAAIETDAEIHLVDAGGGKTLWYPPNTIVDIKDRKQLPVILKVTNNSSSTHNFFLSEDPRFSAPAAFKVSLELKPGETKFIGIPPGDITHLTSGSALTFKSDLESGQIDGQLTFVQR